MAVKRCQKCGKIISDSENDDWFRFIRVKYCRTCGPEVNRQNAKERAKAVRQQVKANNKLRRELANKLLIENKLLREELERSRERIEDLEGVKDYENGKKNEKVRV